MAEDVIQLFEEYAARVARGEEPDARAYLDRAGDEAAKLERLIDGLLLTMPLPEPTEEIVTALRAWLEGEPPLLALRRDKGLKRDAVVARLVELLGLERSKKAKVAGYYHELESGLLDTHRVDRRVFSALSEILSAPLGGILRWRQPAVPGPAAAYYRADPSLEDPDFALPAAGPPAEREWDDVDRLFLGER